MAKYGRQGNGGGAGYCSAIRRLHHSGTGAGSHLGHRIRRRGGAADGYGSSIAHGDGESRRHGVPDSGDRYPNTLPRPHPYGHAGTNRASNPNSRTYASTHACAHGDPRPDTDAVTAKPPRQT